MFHSTEGSTLTKARTESKRSWRHAAKPLVFVMASLALGACVSPVAGSDGRYTIPIGTAPVISNETPYSAALQCLARQGRLAPRIAVGQIADYTGKEEFEGGKRVTQGAALMAMSALAKAGIRLVERFDTSVAELELKYANNRLIGDAGPDGAGGAAFRQIVAGSIPGSDYYLVGGITELNYNLRSVGVDGFVSDPAVEGIKGNIGFKMYVMNVGLDLRLINTSTLEVVDVISYQKQIIGREISSGVFDFLNGTIIDVGAGERALEPVQLAVRSVIERAVLEMMAKLMGVGPSACAISSDPLADGDRAPGASSTTTAALNNEEYQDDENREDAYVWYSGSDPVGGSGLRGGLE